MTMDDAADVGQADAGALELLGAVQPLKHAEQFVRVLHVESDAVVAHEEDDLVGRAWHGADLDLRLRACGGILDRIGQQVDEHEPQQRSVGLHHRKIVQLPGDRDVRWRRS